MELLHGAAFDDLFQQFGHTAFHLELQDTYETPEEEGPFRLFLNGGNDDFVWHEPWLARVREVVGAGKVVRRTRVVTVPHSDYVRWGLSVAPLNIAAGEDVRWLPRHLTSGLTLPTDDFWLFDERRLVFTIFEPSGRWAGGAETHDPGIVSSCVRAYQAVWARSIPHHEYVSSEYASQ